MALLIPALAVLLVVGSFLWMRPSHRDQFLSKLRSEALTSGFRIGSIKLPDLSEVGRINDTQKIFTIYAKTLEISKLKSQPFTVMRTTGEAGIYLPDGWEWHDRQGLSESLMRSIGDFVEALPESVQIINLDQSQAAIAWDEKDASITFEALSSWLTIAAGFVGRKIHGA